MLFAFLQNLMSNLNVLLCVFEFLWCWDGFMRIWTKNYLGDTLLCDTFLPGEALGDGEGDVLGVDLVGVRGDGVLLDEDAPWTVSSVLGLLGAGDAARPLDDGLLDRVLGLAGTDKVLRGEEGREEASVRGEAGLDDGLEEDGVPRQPGTDKELPEQQSSSSRSSET